MGRRQTGTKEECQRIWKIGLYLRLSKEDHAKLAGAIHSDSIENQDKILADFIGQLRRESPQEVFQVEGVFIDDGLTGTNTDKRDSFNRMVDGILKGEINCVLFKDLSRMFRNHTEQSHFLELFCPEHGVRVISINNNLDTYVNPDAVYGYDVTLTGVSNDRYCYTISKNIRRTFDMKRARGEFIGAFAPYGYQKDEENKNRLVVDEEAAAVVRDIFSLFGLGGLTKRAIAQKLNDLGLPSPNEYKKLKGIHYYNPHARYGASLWSPKTIHGILKNEIYLGHMVQGKSTKLSYKIDKFIQKPAGEWVVVPNTHEAIIEETLFRQVQERLALNIKSGSAKDSGTNLFSGVIFCADCGRAMHRKKNKSSAHARFVCRTYSEMSKSACTGSHALREEWIQAGVLKALQTQLMLFGDMTEIAQRAEAMGTDSGRQVRLRVQQEKIREEIKKGEKIADGLFMERQWGTISIERYQRLEQNHRLRMEKQQALLNSMTKELEQMGMEEENKILANIIQAGNIEVLDRLAVVHMVERIWIYNDKTVEIQFKFKDWWCPGGLLL